MYSARLILTNAFCLLAIYGFAHESQQVNIKDEKEQDSLGRGTQVTFIYPLGSNGTEAYLKPNRFSLNLYAGVNGDVDGVEIAGFANVTNGTVNGVQAAGFANIVKSNTKGVQAAGFANVVKDDVQGVQAAGFANVVKGRAEGTQLAGFANVTTDSLEAVQAAGFANIAVDNLKGSQLAGFSNVAKADVKGFQAAGFANVANSRMEGVQVSGFLNRAKSLKGLQIGFLNITDSLEEGMAIGFLSLIGNGYNHLEIGSNELLHAQVSAKLGTERFYNIFSLGTGWHDEKAAFGFGYGIGTLLSPRGKSSIALEAKGYTLAREGDSWDDHGFVGRFDLLFYHNIGQKTALYFGPSFNAQFLRVEEDAQIKGIDVAPYSFFHETYDEVDVKYWMGINLGIRF